MLVSRTGTIISTSPHNRSDTNRCKRAINDGVMNENDATNSDTSNDTDNENKPGLCKRSRADHVDNNNNISSISSDIDHNKNNTFIDKSCDNCHAISHWLVMHLVTAGKQGVQLGIDQAPIIQMNAILGQIEGNKILDQITINIHPDLYIPPLQSQNCQTMTSSSSSSSSSLKSVLQQIGESATITQTISLSCEALDGAGIEQTELKTMDQCSFVDAVHKLHNWLEQNGINVTSVDPTNSNINLITITEDHQTIRNVIYPEFCYRAIDKTLLTNKSPWTRYINLIDYCQLIEINRSPKSDENLLLNSTMTNLFTIAKYFGIEYQLTNNSKFKAELMSKIVLQLISLGHEFSQPQIVRTNYEHKIFSRKFNMADSLVVEVRQVPWSATPSTVANFFTGLNVIPGGVAFRLADGRRSNTAIVAFEQTFEAQLALSRHQHQLYGTLSGEQLLSNTISYLIKTDNNNNNNNVTSELNAKSDISQEIGSFVSEPIQTQQHQQQQQSGNKSTYLQVYPASGKEFVHCAGCDQNPVIDFLNKLTNGEQVVVRMRGLPYTTTKKKIIDFFSIAQAPVMFDESGVYLVVYPDRRPTGDAFVLFEDDRTATKALTRHKDYLGDRYVELFKASPSEMIQICHNVTQQISLNGIQKSTALLESPIISTSSNGRLNFNTTTTSAFNDNLIGSYLPIETQVNNNNLNNSPITNDGTLYKNPCFLTLPSTNCLDETYLPNKTLCTQECLTNINQFNSKLSHPSLYGSVMMMMSTPITNPFGLDPLIRDLTDPTDPDCVFARPLPVGGAQALVQIYDLPLDTSRHEIRLFLGPANFAKVYRMRRMDTNANCLTATWLLSLANITEAVQFIKDLVNRSFNYRTNPPTNCVQTLKCPPMQEPTFGLFHIDSTGKITVVMLNDPQLNIPLHRIHKLSRSDKSITEMHRSHDQTLNNWLQQHHHHQQQPHCTINHHPGSLKIDEEAVNLPSLNNFPNQTSVINQTVSIPRTNENLDYNNLLNSLVQLSNSNSLYINPVSLSLGQSVQTQLNQPQTNTLPLLTESVRPNMNTMAASMVMLTGIPIDVTNEELNSLFLPAQHLLRSQPTFVFFQYQTNGTANYLAIFNNPLDAQTAANCCPHSSLRSSRFPIGAACLVPQSNGMNTNQFNHYLQTNNANLMFLSPQITHT